MNIVSDYLTSKTQHDLTKSSTDDTRTDNPYSSLIKIKADQIFQRKIPFPDTVVSFMSFPVQG